MSSKIYKEEEELIAKILSAYKDEKKPNFTKLAREYGVSRKKLARRWNGLPSRSTRPPTNRLLSSDQDKALFLWLEYLDNISAPPTNEQIEDSANYLLAKDFTGPGEPPRAGKTERTAAEHYGEIERWFIDLKEIIESLKIRPRNLWNFDETGFIVGQGKDEAVVTKYPKAAKRVSSLSSRESITVVESINAEGKIIPPLLIPKGQAFMAELDSLKIYGEADEAIPSSPTTRSISPPSTVTKLRRYINKIDKSLNAIKDILDNASPGLTSLILAELGELHRENFTKVRDTAKRKNQKTTKRHVKASGALYVKDANRLIKRRHDGDLLRIHKSHILGVDEPEQQEARTEPQNLGFFIDTRGNR
ncbi:hypothetical protein DPV78_011709 [Talaromyces pinophilus]|nr:hypothetical protein DPV78_011709 [Talaromyces pinophilus]